MAGCAFKDAFAPYLRALRSYPVKVINWGLWGEVGAVAAESYRHRIEKNGIQPLGTEEGLDAFERILASSQTQVAAVKMTPAAMRALNLKSPQDGFSAATGHLRDYLSRHMLPSEIETALRALDSYARTRTRSILQQMGWTPGRAITPVDAASALGIAPSAQALFAAILKTLDRTPSSAPGAALETTFVRP